MNKPELIDAVAERAGVSKKMAQQMLDTTIAVIREALLQGESVRISGLGILYVQQRSKRLAMNPRTGMTITLPARKIIKFKIAKDLKRNLNGGKK